MTLPGTQTDEKAMQTLAEFERARKKRKTRPLGVHGNKQWAELNRHNIVRQRHLGGPSLGEAHGPAEAESSLQLAPQDAEPGKETNLKLSPSLWRRNIKLAFFMIFIIAMAFFCLPLIRDIFGTNKPIPQKLQQEEARTNMVVLDTHQPHVRLNEAVDIPGLYCLAGELAPQSRLQPQGVTLDPKLAAELFKMLEDLSDAEEMITLRLHRLRVWSAEIRRLVEKFTAAENQSLSLFIRVKAIREMQNLMAQASKLREQINQLQDDINKQVDNLIPRMTAKAQSFCSITEQSTLMDVYRDRIWKDSGQSVSADKDKLVLMHQGFCISFREVIDGGRPNGATKGSPLLAAPEAGRLYKEVDKLIMPMAIQTLGDLESGCGIFCVVISCAYDLLQWGRGGLE